MPAPRSRAARPAHPVPPRAWPVRLIPQAEQRSPVWLFLLRPVGRMLCWHVLHKQHSVIIEAEQTEEHSTAERWRNGALG
ncbi:hypothetical protein M440DRAFT_1149778 [Trichoderma longibrachiatum ATCC 18648]|uniref:Uncharacterized protein n=1 Tax=Trichoderma longibrachiatum ATCC 18648 TaxID=983965 RepID=A0A2T4BQ45_TRILO|nr:hypothetical protein M440DRAFT_1149778 [Trichoderma longibrachiatum ATCC 18648]